MNRPLETVSHLPWKFSPKTNLAPPYLDAVFQYLRHQTAVVSGVHVAPAWRQSGARYSSISIVRQMSVSDGISAIAALRASSNRHGRIRFENGQPACVNRSTVSSCFRCPRQSIIGVGRRVRQRSAWGPRSTRCYKTATFNDSLHFATSTPCPNVISFN